MIDQTADQDADRETERVEESKARGIPPEMEENEAKGGPGDERLQSEVSHGKPDDGRHPTGEG